MTRKPQDGEPWPAFLKTCTPEELVALQTELRQSQPEGAPLAAVLHELARRAGMTRDTL